MRLLRPPYARRPSKSLRIDDSGLSIISAQQVTLPAFRSGLFERDSTAGPLCHARTVPPGVSGILRVERRSRLRGSGNRADKLPVEPLRAAWRSGPPDDKKYRR